jgi:leucyl aminopeptidase
MDISLLIGDALSFEGDLLVIGRYQDEEATSEEKELDEALGNSLSKRCQKLLFKGSAGQKLSLDTTGRLPFEQLLLIGLGKKDSCDGKAIRDRAAEVAREALSRRSTSVALCFGERENELHSQELLLGFELGLYRFDALQTPSEDTPRPEVTQLSVPASLTDKGKARAHSLANAVNLARTLVNEPPNVCTPSRLADVALSLASEQVEVTIFEKEEIYERAMGGLIAVSQGATQDPRFIHVHYKPQGEF